MNTFRITASEFHFVFVKCIKLFKVIKEDMTILNFHKLCKSVISYFQSKLEMHFAYRGIKNIPKFAYSKNLNPYVKIEDDMSS